MGRVAALIHDILPAKQVIDSMVDDAAEIMTRNAALVQNVAKL
jgi:hypothetical protein